MADVRKHMIFHGRVQGVGFRYTAKYLARSMNLTGWVKNEYDGTVVMEVQGREAMIFELMKGLNRNQFIQIDWIDTEEKETLPEKEPVKTKEQQTGDKNKGAVKHEKKKATAETYDSTHMTLWLLTAVSLALLGIIKLYGMRKKS